MLPRPVRIEELAIRFDTEDQVIGTFEELLETCLCGLHMSMTATQYSHQIIADHGRNSIQQADPEPHQEEKETVTV